jgi:Uncharacterized protein conserved in bacteria (DUF2188)
MATSGKTLHVLPEKDGRWSVQKIGRKSSVFSTQGEAIKAARKIALQGREAQVVAYEPSGKLHTITVRGLPAVQKPPTKSRVGNVAIARAVSKLVRKRLEHA